MLLENSGQFNWMNWEFVNFPDFCQDATTILLPVYFEKIYLGLSAYENIILRKMFKKAYSCQNST